MNKKRSTILLVLLGAIVFPLFTGCFGVGEDDPFISLRTRKARLTGKWDISSYYKNVKQIMDTSDQKRVITDVQPPDYNKDIYILGTDSVQEIEGEVLNGEMSFDKNGYFSYVFEYEVVESETDEESSGTTTETRTVKREMNGTWNFLHNIDDYKRKERLSLVVLNEANSVKTTVVVESEEEEGVPVITVSRDFTVMNYANGEMSYIWELDMLKYKEVHKYQNINTVVVSTDSAAYGTAYDEVGYQQRNLTRVGDESAAATEEF
ncbi:MAG: hypothetical protein PF590_03675 [Candidatus Delongbacteria bacterium]|jgi:hypothetical protein|nr:hypothetical protein [Candidatus Delongbacteria bacterium]